MDSHFVWHVIHCVRDLMEHRMRGSIAVRVDYSVSDLRKLARQEKNGRVVLRLTAIASVLEGASRQDAASHSGMDRQTLCDWVHRFNAQGPEGLRDAPCGHPKKRLTPEQEKAVKARVLKGPDPKKDGLVRWRCVDIQRWIEAEYKVHYHERTIGKLLHVLNLSHVSTRPLHPESDVEVQAAFKKTLTPKSRKSSPDTPLASVSKSGFRACPREGGG